MPEGGDRLLLLERFPADGSLLAVREAALRAGRRFPHDKFGRMPRRLYFQRFAGELFFAHGAVDGFVIRALFGAGRGLLVLADGRARRMSLGFYERLAADDAALRCRAGRRSSRCMPLGGNDRLRRQNGTADGTLAAIREARFRTRRSLCGHRFGRMSRTRAVHFFFAGE